MLTETAIKSAKPAPKLRKLSDAGGLQIWIMPDGAKYWRVAYRFDCKQKLLALGTYPLVTLKDAREAAMPPSGIWPPGATPASKRSSTG